MNCCNLFVFGITMTKKKSSILQLVHFRDDFTLHNYLDLSGENVYNQMWRYRYLLHFIYKILSLEKQLIRSNSRTLRNLKCSIIKSWNQNLYFFVRFVCSCCYFCSFWQKLHSQAARLVKNSEARVEITS